MQKIKQRSSLLIVGPLCSSFVSLFFLEFLFYFFLILVSILAFRISPSMSKLSCEDICQFFYSESKFSFYVWGIFYWMSLWRSKPKFLYWKLKMTITHFPNLQRNEDYGVFALDEVMVVAAAARASSFWALWDSSVRVQCLGPVAAVREDVCVWSVFHWSGTGVRPD